MKTAKKVISVIMAVIMLFTGSPILQASDMVNLDRAQIAELQKEILQDVKVNLNKSKDPVQELMSLYQQAKKNFEGWSEKIEKIEVKEEDQKAAEEYTNQLNERAEELARNDERYLVVPENERKKVAMASLLFIDMYDVEDAWEIVEFPMIQMLIGTTLLSELAMVIIVNTRLYDVTFWWFHNPFEIAARTLQGSLVGILAWIIIELFVSSYTPVLSPSMSAEETCKVFSEKPFDILAEFDKKESSYNDWVNVYSKCPNLVTNVVNTAYIASGSFNAKNVKGIAYLSTIDWREMTPKQRENYFRDFVENSVAESRIKASKYSKRVGLEEK